MAGILYHIEIPCHLCCIPYLFFQYECYFTVIVNVTFSLFAVFVHVTVVFPGFIPTNSISSSYIPSSISSNARIEESPEDSIWVRSIASYGHWSRILYNMLWIFAVLFPITVFISAFVGYHILKKALQPIYTISDMAKEHLDKIWNRFYRVDKSRSAGEGFGLGLSMVRFIVDIHGGSIAVKSKPGYGTTFTVSL